MQKLQRSVGEAERDYQVSLHSSAGSFGIHSSEHLGGTILLPCQQAEVIELEAVVEEVHEGFQSLDQQMSRAGQTATKIGDRLQVERRFNELLSTQTASVGLHMHCQHMLTCTHVSR